MSFQAYHDNIQAKTGKTPSDFKELADKKWFTQNGKIKEGVKATQITILVFEFWKWSLLTKNQVRMIKNPLDL